MLNKNAFIMKKFYSILLAQLLAAAGIWAQNDLRGELFFDNNIYNLSAEQTARLDSLVAQAKDYQWIKASVSGMADQRGPSAANEKLAQRRAESVRAYLLQKGIGEVEISTCQVLPVGIEKSNRRADIRLTYEPKKSISDSDKVKPAAPPAAPPVEPTEEGLALQSLSSFFAYSARQNQQKTNIDPNKANQIRGKKGAILLIPAAALERTDGSAPVGKVEVELIEAHSYADMLLNNLSTASGDKQLETGGMVKINATDSEGQALRLRQDKPAILSLPSPNANASGMMVFNGEIDPHANIDWQTDGRPVLSQMATNTPFGPLASWDSIAAAFNNAAALAAKFDFVEIELPRRVAKPKNWPEKAPQRPNLPAIEEPQLSNYYETYERQRIPFSEYQEKAKNAYEKDLATYKIELEKQNKVLAGYSRDSSAYAKRFAQHNTEIDAYKNYEKALREVVFLALEGLNEMNFERTSAALNKNALLIQKLTSSGQKNNEKYAYLDSTLQVFEGMKPIFGEMQKSLTQLDRNQRFVGEINALLGEINKAAAWLKEEAEAISSTKDEVKSASQIFDNSARYQLQRLYYKNEWSEEDCNAVIAWLKSTKETNFAAAHKILKKYTKSWQKNRPAMQAYHRICEEYATLYAESRNVAMLEGLLPPQEIANELNNALVVSELGWINCDKFIGEPSTRGGVEILTDKGGENTVFYVVFKDIRSVMKALPMSDRFFLADGLPIHLSVTVIGLRIADGKAEMSYAEGTVRDFERYKPKFEERSMKEVLAELNKLG